MIIISKFYNFLNNFKENTSMNIGEVFSLVSFKIYLVVLILLNGFQWTFCYFFLKKLTQNSIILHYNVDFGADLFGDANRIMNIPILGLFIIIFNFIIPLVFLKTKHFKFIMHLFLGTAILVNIFLLLSLGPIYLINFG